MKLTSLSPNIHWYVLFCLIAIFVALYHPALTNDYAYSDDYHDFLGVPGENGGASGIAWVFDKRLLEGRPIYAGIYYVSAWFVETLSDIRWIRLLGIFGIALASWCVFRELVRQEFGRLPSFFVAVIVGMSVPFQLAGSWATVSAFPYAFAVSYAAFLIAEHSLKQRATIKYALIVASIICLLMAFWIYQPVALSFWAFFAVGILRKQNITGNDIRRVFVYLCITATVVGLSVLTYETARSVLNIDYYEARGGLIAISDIPERIPWLMNRMATAVVFPVTPGEYSPHWPWYTLPHIASSKVLFKHILVFLPLVAVLAGLVLYFRDRPQFMKRCVIACVLPVLCYGIMLVSENSDPQRTRMALSFLAIVYLFLAVHGYARYINRTPSAFVNCVMGFIVFVGVALSSWHNERQFVEANVIEIQYIRSELQQHDLKSYDAIHVVRPDSCFRGGTFVPRGYLVPSSCMDWASDSMVKFLLIDLHADTFPLRLSSSAYGDEPVPRTNTLVIDMEKGIRAYRAGGAGAQ